MMTAMFADIREIFNTPKMLEPIDGIQFNNLLYADDTLLFGTNTHNINKLLHAIEYESAYYNMKLNYDKCINLTINRVKSSIKYLNGGLVPRDNSAKYLGAILTDSVDNSKELNMRIADVSSTANKMKLE